MSEIEQHPYRWVIVIAAALILALSMGAIVNGMSAYIVPLQDSYGWARADISLINVSGIVGLAFGGVLTGALADKFGTRPVVLIGGLAMGLSYLGASYATALWQFYVLMFIAGFFGAAAISPPLLAAVGSWFPKGAGLAIGIAAAGQALGQGGVPFASSLLIQSVGTAKALTVTGVAMLLLLVPLALVLRQPPKSVLAAGTRAADQSGGFQKFSVFVPTMSLATFLCCTCMSIPLMHLVPLIQDKGFAADQAGRVIFVMLMVAITGRVAFGKFADIIGPLRSYMTATAW
ncbi:MFS transporter, partial [Actibacterium sp.]|uniref:MFS transporter n=1 Tax=Actibacterium sp. TaxID=1872125 RepID=UPI0035648EC7